MQKIPDSFDIHKHGATAFAWLNNQQQHHLKAVTKPNGELATSCHEILEAVAHARQQLFNKESLVDIDLINHHFGWFCTMRPRDVPMISGSDLKSKNLQGKEIPCCSP